MAVQITEVENELRNPTHDEILAGLKWLMDAGMAYSVSLKSGEEETAYLSILKAVPTCGLRKALTKLRHGLYENINHAFIPLPAELAAMSRAEAKAERDHLTRLNETRRTLEDNAKPAPEVSDEAKARIKAMLSSFRAAHQEAKLMARGGHIPMTPEKAAMLAKIMDMPDAKNVTAEQQAYRRKVAADLSKEQGE